MISEEALQALRGSYDKLTADIRDKGHDNIWGYMLNVKNNTRYNTLYDASVLILSSTVSSELLEAGLMRPSKEEMEYIITAHGIALVESDEGIDTFATLIEEIDSRFMEIDIRGLSPREKILLFSMIMARSFAESCCIDASKEDYVRDHWMEIFLRAQEKLRSVGVIGRNTAIETLGERSNIEKKMSNIIRHTDALDVKVKMLYKKTGKNQYYLDMARADGSLDINRLSFIISMIFGEKLSYENIDGLIEFCNESSRADSALLYDMDGKVYLGSDYDDMIEEAFRETLRNNMC